MQIFPLPINEAVVVCDLKSISSPGYLWLIEVSIHKTSASTVKVTKDLMLPDMFSKGIFSKLLTNSDGTPSQYSLLAKVQRKCLGFYLTCVYGRDI